MKKDSMVISLSKKHFRNDIYIQNADALEQSFFRTVYEQIVDNINNIIEINQKRRDAKKDLYFTLNNIIPLISGRGTGKTSTLVSTMNLLQDSQSLKKFTKMIRSKHSYSEQGKKRSVNIDEYKFLCINKIDADLLEKKESIFEVILAGMYNEFQKSYRQRTGDFREYQMRELTNEFDNIFQHFRLLNMMKTEDQMKYSSIQSLHESAMSMNLKMDFEKLVEKYLDFMESCQERNKTFLVITIDDIDMNIDNGFAYLEQIHRYLMVPNVIVLLAFDISQLLKICEKHFAQICPDKKLFGTGTQGQNNVDFWEKYVLTLTQNYIDKILPIENRVYLPGIRNENKKVYVTGYRDIDEGDVENSAQEIKWVALRKILRRTGIICDGLGKKKHYYEPDTLRQVVSFVDYLNMMDIIPQNSCLYKKNQNEVFPDIMDQINILEENLQMNIEKIYKDIVERMENEKLDPDQKRAFDEIRRQHVTRQSRSAYDFLRKTLKNSDYNQDIFLLDRAKDELQFNVDADYTYGEYMYMIYNYSHKIEKMMIHMLIALQTANLTSLYNELRIIRRQCRIMEDNTWEKLSEKQRGELEKLKEKLKKNQYEILINFRQIFDNSITGSWFVEIWKQSGDMPQAKKAIGGGKQIVFDCSQKSMMIGIESAFVYAVHVIYMLFPNVKNISLNGNIFNLKLTIDSQTHFDPWGFVVESMDYERHFQKVQNAISKLYGTEAFKNHMNENMIQTVDQIIDALKKEYSDWADRRGMFALPVYSLDVYYNLLKRLYENKESNWENSREQWEDISKPIVTVPIWNEKLDNDINQFKSKKMLEAYLRVLKKVKVQLIRQDEYYVNKMNEEKEIFLTETFMECPFVEILIGENESLGKIHTMQREIAYNLIGQALRYNFGNED